MNKKSSVVQIILAVLSVAVIVFSIYGVVNVYHSRVALLKQVNQSSTQLKAAQTAYKDKVQAISNQTIVEAKSSKDPAVRSVAVQNTNYDKVTKVSNQFFRYYYTWGNSKTYLARKNKVKDITTASIRNNKSIFDDGKDSTGGNFIKSLGSHSEFDKASAYMTQNSGSTVQALVKVVNTGWTTDTEDNPGQSTHYYDLTYDLKTNKISNLKLVFTEKSDDSDD
ncbi:hypothetical protein [Lactobacillus sp.]|uniref:hypothetical protein n=1 Tax=Lactobacillus sp. TaxID=1591 RepID=UPI0019B9C4FF|nr:hypothetical protein [Lactobacillus sp.]MBD5430511.1 hypothetical protein [Lactobacillus sp.]MBD5430802.1 hypothetical protein [Lactobacillus sp.]